MNGDYSPEEAIRSTEAFRTWTVANIQKLLDRPVAGHASECHHHRDTVAEVKALVQRVGLLVMAALFVFISDLLYRIAVR